MSSLDSAPANDLLAHPEVVSCTFLRYNCDHPVFQKEYTRSNRRRKTKILRCFPHCCPEHIPRCYCGCSIHILVTFKDASIVSDSEIIVCARFEACPSDEQPSGKDNDAAATTATRKLAHGETVALPAEVLQPMPQDSVESSWVRAYREGESKQQSVPENSVLYVMNNYRFPKWYYGYESGATKSQREMKHYLRIYVLRLERPKDLPINWSGSWFASVVARHSSPSFTLISYRRAGDYVNGAKPKKVKIGVGASEKFGGSSTESEGNGSEYPRRNVLLSVSPLQKAPSASAAAPGQHRSRSRQEAPHYDHDNAEGILLGLRYGDHGASFLTGIDSLEEQNPFNQDYTDVDASLHPSSLRSRDETQPESRLPRDVDEKIFWRQPKYAKTVEHARQLSVLQYFLTHAALDELWSAFMNLEDRVRQVWIDPLYNQTKDSRSRQLLVGFCLPSPSRQHVFQRDQATLIGRHPVLVHCAEVGVEFATSRSLRDFARSTLQLDMSAVGPRRLETRQQFAECVDGVYSHLDAFLSEKRVPTLAALVDELVTLVYQNQRFRWMQGAIRELLSMATPDTFAFEAFCAQSRELLMASWRPQPDLQVATSEASGGDGRRWSRRWLLDSRSLRVRDSREDAQLGAQYRFQAAAAGVGEIQFSAWELLSTIQQFGAVDLELASSASLRVRSVFGTDERVFQPMYLTLDGKYRIFRTFPNGASTMAVARDGWVYGDYFGYLESASSIKIWCFTYQKHSSSGGGVTPARCIAAQLTLTEPDRSWQARYGDRDVVADQLMHVSVKIDDAMCPHANREGDEDLGSLPSGVRHGIWKSLQWKPSAEFDVEYQRILG